MNCGAICLQYVESLHGRALSLPKARALCKVTPNGTYIADLVDAFATLGYANPRLIEHVSWAHLTRLVKAGNEVLVSWWSDLDTNGKAAPADGHWSVATHVTPDAISIFDPDPEEIISLPREFFIARWYDYERAPNGKRVDLHRAAVVTKYPAA